MSKPEISVDIRESDTRWTQATDRCSRCRQQFPEHYIPLILWPQHGHWELRYHWTCAGHPEAEPYEGEEGDYDAPEYDAPLDLGPCCVCETSGPSVRNLLAFEHLAAIPGHGWGCVVCGLPGDGAQAVLCDDCLGPIGENGLPGKIHLKFVCRGYPASEGREPLSETEARPRFAHDQARHHAFESEQE